MNETTQSTVVAPRFPVRHGEVDGVRTLSADLPVDPTLTLTFGVGYADATPTTAGITHLVEHLVMRRVGYVAVPNNAESGLLATSFYAVGGAAERADFIRRVCEAVSWVRGVTDADLELERQTILSEIGPAGIYASSDPFSMRYGIHGPGLTAVTHARLLDWTAAEVREVAAAWFHRDNACLVSTTALPDDLSLPLPAGAPIAARPQADPLLAGRSWAHGPSPELVLSGTCPATVDEALRTVAATVLRDVLHETLRTVSGRVYSVDLGMLPVGDREEVWTLTTDPSETVVCDVMVAALDVVDRLATDGPTVAELERTRGTLLHGLGLSSMRAGWLDGAAVYGLRGLTLTTVERSARVTAEATAADVGAVIAHVAASLLVTLPAGHVPHEGAAARLDGLAYADPFPDREVPTGPGRAPVTVDGDRTRVVSALMRGHIYPGKLFSPARGSQVAILSDRLILVSRDDMSIVPFADIVLVGTDRDGDVEIVTRHGGVICLTPGLFRGLTGPLTVALGRLPQTRPYVKDRPLASATAD